MNAHFQPGTELMPRATVEDLVARRNHALKLYDIAHGALIAASDALDEARKASSAASPGVNRYNHHLDKGEFHGGMKVAAHPDFMERARRIVDTDVWSHIIELTDLERLMDKKAKDQFNEQLRTEPPEVTVDNVRATLQQFAADVGTIFKRGIAECFSELDKRFRSHDGWKIGSRVILTHAFTESGHWNWHWNRRDTLMDVERVFRILDGDTGKWLSIVHDIENARGREWGARQTVVDTTYFLIRIYKNGNAHLWFKRDDLVERVNKLLGEYYGAPIPEEREPTDDGDLFNPKLTPAKNFGFFPTPDAAARTLLERVPLYREKGDPAPLILEPSAGSGNLARLCIKGDPDRVSRPDRFAFGGKVDCVEIQAALADALKAEHIYRKVYHRDFLSLAPSTTGLYDYVVMNPPFDRERDIDHVIHALDFLKPDGSLHAIMSAGTEFRETRKSTAFRALIEKMGGRFSDLPAGSFSSVGTNCNTLILRVKKDGSRPYW